MCWMCKNNLIKWNWKIHAEYEFLENCMFCSFTTHISFWFWMVSSCSEWAEQPISWKGKTDFQNAAQEAHEALHVRKEFSEQVVFCKMMLCNIWISRERPIPWPKQSYKILQKNAGIVSSTSIPLLYTVGQVCRLLLTLGGAARATDAIWLQNA